MPSGRVCKRQHIADPLARLTSHVHYSGMYGLCRQHLVVECPERVTLDLPRRPAVSPPSPDRHAETSFGFVCVLYPTLAAFVQSKNTRETKTIWNTSSRAHHVYRIGRYALLYTLRIALFLFSAPANAMLFAVAIIKCPCLIVS
jgi:hypothetical protein